MTAPRDKLTASRLSGLSSPLLHVELHPATNELVSPTVTDSMRVRAHRLISREAKSSAEKQNVKSVAFLGRIHHVPQCVPVLTEKGLVNRTKGGEKRRWCGRRHVRYKSRKQQQQQQQRVRPV
ncbi:Hypothetical predicted protein [Xyrichtys novacula]|uniref:Uncharacterized protein n=1 Tax=Xyrichtys novacula TaxID=13765 RepID=A0AAV1FTA9_XYRNO|nr:Hypothetical predicted protein [Xyrichtys novacula]